MFGSLTGVQSEPDNQQDHGCRDKNPAEDVTESIDSKKPIPAVYTVQIDYFHVPFDPFQVLLEKSDGGSKTSLKAVSLVFFQQIVCFGYNCQACQDYKTNCSLKVHHTGSDEERHETCVGQKQFYSKTDLKYGLAKFLTSILI